jgi:hypothetical protein
LSISGAAEGNAHLARHDRFSADQRQQAPGHGCRYLLAILHRKGAAPACAPRLQHIRRQYGAQARLKAVGQLYRAAELSPEDADAHAFLIDSHLRPKACWCSTAASASGPT